MSTLAWENNFSGRVMGLVGNAVGHDGEHLFKKFVIETFGLVWQNDP